MSHGAHLSRREFTALATAAAVAPFAAGTRTSASAAITAQDVIDRIRQHIGVDWRAETVDTIKAGEASTAVTGIVTTSLASMAVLQQAVKSGANLVITGHPTFYSRGDARTPASGRGRGGGPAGATQAVPPPPPPADPVFTAKNDFIATNRLVVFRLSDHWRLRAPNPLAEGLGDTLGWSARRVGGDPSRYDIPAMTVDALARHVKSALGARGGMRVIGNPQTRVQKVALLPGSTPIGAALAALPGADAIIAGEVREWESVEYARDVVFSGQPKALILLGRIVSEEPGMNMCANWLKTFVPEVPVRHIAAGDPYWRP